MSVFICSDRHFAVVAKALFAHPVQQQIFADALKRQNIKSFNWRYKEHNRFRKVRLDDASAEYVKAFDGHDVLQLLICIDYQSCEHPDYDDTLYSLAERMLKAQGANDKAAKPNLWSI